MKNLLCLIMLSFTAAQTMDLSQAPTSTELDLSNPKIRENIRNNLLAAYNGKSQSHFKQELVASASSTYVSVQTSGNAPVSVSIESNSVTTIKR